MVKAVTDRWKLPRTYDSSNTRSEYNTVNTVNTSSVLYNTPPPLQSVVSVMGELCQGLMSCSNKELTRRDKDVLCALLFLARQIYTTHEGLAVMGKFRLVSLANEVLSVSGNFQKNIRANSRI